MSAQQGQDKGDNAYNILWLIALVMIIGTIVWYAYSPQLKLVFVYLRLCETWLIYYALWPLYALNLPYVGTQSPVAPLLMDAQVLAGVPSALNVDIARELSLGVGHYLKYPIGLILVYLGYNYWTVSVQQRFKKRYDMKSLSRNQQELWPQIRIVSQLDLVSEDVDRGPWAMAMTPAQYCRKYKLMDLTLVPQGDFSINKEEKYQAILFHEQAAQVLSAQLGRAWNGAERMAPHRRAIFAIFIARGCRDTQAAQKLMAQLSRSAANGKLDYTGADELWRKHINNKQVVTITSRHAYELTLMASALELAREDGVVPSADFLWVKPFDRKLWYVLNTIGRQTAYVEIAGIFCHWTTEKLLRKPLSVPAVDEALKALEGALSEMVYKPDEAELKAIHERAQGSVAS